MSRATAQISGDRRLGRLLRDIGACRICRDAPLLPAPLPHEPRPVLRAGRRARILVAGQAPGTRVHASGQPYADRSGERLRQWLGIGADEFYDADRVAIVPMGFCFPGLAPSGADLPPRRECAATWHDRLLHELENIGLVLAIGRFAQVYHFRRLGLGAWVKPSLDATMRCWQEIWNARARPRVMPLPHPSWHNSHWLARNPWFEAELVPLLRAEVHRLLDR